MRLSQIGPVVGVATAAAFVVGCGGSDKAPVSEQTGPKPVEVRDLPELDEPLTPLDDERIEVSPPTGWFIPSRSSQWIVRFQASRRLKYPRIFITAKDYENVFNVSKANVEEFAQQIAVALDEDPNVAKLADPVTPIEIGSLVGITHRRRAKDKEKQIVERLFVETVVAGRKYAIELQARKGTLQEYRPYLLAVAGGIKFLKAGAAQPPEDKPPEDKPPPTEPPEDQPPDENPPEDAPKERPEEESG